MKEGSDRKSGRGEWSLVRMYIDAASVERVDMV